MRPSTWPTGSPSCAPGRSSRRDGRMSSAAATCAPPRSGSRCRRSVAEGDRMVVYTREPVRAAHLLTDWAMERDIDLGHFSVTQPTLEDIYLELTGAMEQTAEREEAML